VALYPQPWRERYASEMGALLEEDPPSPRGLLSLLGGALDAHLRPQAGWRAAIPPDAPRAVLARLSPSPTVLRRAARATPALAIVLVACGLALYAAALALQAPSLAGVSSGPVGASTGVMLAGEALLALCVCGPALVCAARARATTL